MKDTGASGDSEIDKEDATPYFGTDVLSEGKYVVAGTRYITYVLGEGSIDYEDIGARVPYEMARDPKTKGGLDTLYTRQRKVFAPRGISYEKKHQKSNSPTDAELRNGANWCVVHSGEDRDEDRSYVADKAIPIARIISRG